MLQVAYDVNLKIQRYRKTSFNQLETSNKETTRSAVTIKLHTIGEGRD